MAASRGIIALCAVAIVLTCLVKSATALLFSRPVQSTDNVIPIAPGRWSPAGEKTWIGYRVAMLEGMSFREQHLYQEILAVLLLNNASGLPSIRPCELKVTFLDPFGDFAIGVGHPDSPRRLGCLRGAVGYLLRQPISAADFMATDRDRAYGKRMGYYLQTYAQQLALLAIYEKNSPLYQIHSITREDLANVPFEKFDAWLRRSREQNLITFGGKRALLDSLDLPVPDPMVWRPIPSLRSPRTPAGVLFFEGERLKVPALIMLSLDGNDPDPMDPQIRHRLACNESGPTRLGAASASSAISRVSCELSNWFGDSWLSLAIDKSDGASYQEFCRQVQELTKDADVAALVRGSPEGSKGLYVLLPKACEIPQ